MARSFNAIKKDMVEGISRPLFNDVLDYCSKNNTSWEDFMVNLPPIIAMAWAQSSDVGDWLEQHLAPKKTRQGREWFYPNQDHQELATNSTELLSAHFITCWIKDRWQTFRIHDRDNKIAAPVVTDDGLRTVQKLVADELWQDGCAINSTKIGVMWDYFQTFAESEDHAPKPLAQLDEDCWAFSRVKSRPDPTMPYPSIQTFLDRLDDPEGFAAWHYGVHSGKLARGRQILWLEGPGEGGKSIWFDTFGREFGDATAAMTGAAIKEPKFLNALIENKHFACIADCKNSRLLLTEGFQNMASGGFDQVPIEHKYGPISMGYINAKWAIGSNYKPFIINETYNKSRTLWFTMSEFTGVKDPTIGDKWAAEMPGFLAYAQRCYAERCKNDYEITVNEACAAKKLARISDASEEHDVTLEVNFVLDPLEKLSPKDMGEALKEYGIRDHAKQSFFHEYLEREHGVAKAGRPASYRGIRLRTPADEADEVVGAIKARIEGKGIQ